MSCQKILTLEQAIGQATRLRQQGRRVVLALGCFDLLHPGHTHYLVAARKLGDVLFVGVRNDESTYSLKGAGRPVLPALERAEIVAALEVVDLVSIFDAPSGAALLAQIQPDIVVQAANGDSGENLSPEQARAAGAQLVHVPVLPGYSTSAVIQAAIQNLC